MNTMSKQPKQTGDNSWLGIHGVGMATLFDAKGRALGRTLDAPNPIAHAMAADPAVDYAIGLFGDKITREALADRFWFAGPDKKLAQYLKWYAEAK